LIFGKILGVGEAIIDVGRIGVLGKGRIM